MRALKEVTFQIQVNRQRLHFAVVTNNQSLAERTLNILTHLHSSYFDLTRKGALMSHKETFYLVFSEEYQDGIVLSSIQYRELTKRMDRADLQSHVAVEVDKEMVGKTEQTILTETKTKQSA